MNGKPMRISAETELLVEAWAGNAGRTYTLDEIKASLERHVRSKMLKAAYAVAYAVQMQGYSIRDR